MLMLSLVSRKFLAMRNITLYSVHTVKVYIEICLPRWYQWVRVIDKAIFAALTHFGFQWPKPAKNKLTWFQDFPSKFQHIYLHLFPYTWDCMCFALKICQHVACTRKIRQFHELLNLIFGGFLPFGPSVQQHTAESDCCQIIVQIGNSHINQQENERRCFFCSFSFQPTFDFKLPHL